jgi:hypothetical protein
VTLWSGFPATVTAGEDEMENRGGEIHIETDEARGGSTPHIVRYVLIISMILAIGLLSIVWITGAINAG